MLRKTMTGISDGLLWAAVYHRTSDQAPWMNFVSKYGWIPSTLPSRPSPDCLNPPKGCAVQTPVLFTNIWPVRTRRAMCSPKRRIGRVHRSS